MWGPRLPKKTGVSLAHGSEPLAEGWGIQIQERPHWALLTTLMFIFLLLSGLVAGIYSWRTGDHQTGVAIGAWLATVQTMGITTLFFWWT